MLKYGKDWEKIYETESEVFGGRTADAIRNRYYDKINKYQHPCIHQNNSTFFLFCKILNVYVKLFYELLLAQNFHA